MTQEAFRIVLDGQIKDWIEKEAKRSGLSMDILVNQLIAAQIEYMSKATILNCVESARAIAAEHLRAYEPLKDASYIIFACKPSGAVDELPFPTLEEIAREASRHPNAGWPVGVNLPNRSLPYRTESGLEFLLPDNDLRGNPSFDYWSLSRSAFFLAMRSRYIVLDSQGEGLEFVWLARDIVESLYYLLALSKALAARNQYGGSFDYIVELHQIAGVRLTTIDPARSIDFDYKTRATRISAKREWLPETLSKNFTTEGNKVLNEVFGYFGFDLKFDLAGEMVNKVLTFS